MKRRRYWILIATAVVVFTLVFRPVVVSGRSMEPSLFSGDLLLTAPTWLRTPQRGDLVVLRDPVDHTRVVKRLMGLPGETVQIVGEDLLLDGSPLSRSVVGRGSFIPLTGEGGVQVEVRHGDAQSLPNGWRFTTRGALAPDRVLLDGWTSQDSIDPGTLPTADLALSLRYRLESPDAALVVSLRQGDRAFRLTLARAGSSLRLEQAGDGAPLVLAERAVSPPRPSGELFFSQLDGTLLATIDGTPLLRVVPTGSRPESPLGAEMSRSQTSFWIDITGPVEVTDTFLGRDLAWRPVGRFAIGSPLSLADEEFFVLGDAPGQSRDSRSFGPVSTERIEAVVVLPLWSSAIWDGPRFGGTRTR